MSTLRAGVLAGLVGIVVTLLVGVCGGLALPRFLLSPGISLVLACFLTLISLAVWLVIGILAAHWLQAPRSPGQGLGAGALAGLVMSLVSLCWWTVNALTRGLGFMATQLTPEQLRLLREAGLRQREFALGILVAAVVCIPLLAILLSAIGGAVYAAINPGRRSTPTAL